MISRNDTKTSSLLFPQYPLFKNALIIPSDPISCRNEFKIEIVASDTGGPLS